MSNCAVHLVDDNLTLLSKMESESVDLIYIDPPFNTGKTQSSRKTKAVVDDSDDPERTGFGGRSYKLVDLSGTMSYNDAYHDGYMSFISSRLEELHRVLKPTGCLYLHIGYTEVHYVKVLGDTIFGRKNFLNEIIWAYDFGGKPKTRWPAKHSTILLWAKEKGTHLFNINDIDRIPYMAPGMVTAEKAAKGKLPTDTWWHTIVAPQGKEKTGYPTQKPINLLKRIVIASSPPGGLVLDCFAGSGTTGEASLLLGRDVVLMDSNPDAIKVMRKRFKPYSGSHTIKFIRKKTV